MGNKSSSTPPPPPPPPPTPPAPLIISPPKPNVPPPPNYNLNSEQLQAVQNDNFTWYSIATMNPMSKIKMDLPALQQCFSTKNSGDCVGQYFKGLDDNLNSLQPLNKGVSGITVDSGGNIIWPQNFQNIDNQNNCQQFSPNMILFTMLTIFLIVILLNQ